MYFPIVTSDALFVDLLNNASKTPMFIEAGTEAFDKQGEEFSNYRADVHCGAVIYTAMPLERNNGVLPTKYVVTCVVYKLASRMNYKAYNDTPL